MIAVGRSSYHILLYIITPCRFFVLSSVLRCVAHYFFFVTYETLLTFNITAEVSGRSGGDIDDRDGLNAGGNPKWDLIFWLKQRASRREQYSYHAHSGMSTYNLKLILKK